MQIQTRRSIATLNRHTQSSRSLAPPRVAAGGEPPEQDALASRQAEVVRYVPRRFHDPLGAERSGSRQSGPPSLQDHDGPTTTTVSMPRGGVSRRPKAMKRPRLGRVGELAPEAGQLMADKGLIGIRLPV